MDGTGLTMHPCKEVVKLETFNCDKSLQKTRNAKSGETFGDSCIYHPWHPLPWSLAPPLRKLTPCIVELEPQGGVNANLFRALLDSIFRAQGAASGADHGTS